MERIYEKPTSKQINYIRSIEEALGFPFDYDHGSKCDATAYIKQHAPQLKEYQRAMQLDYEAEMSFVDARRDW